MDELRVSENGRYLVDTVGRPVFLLADAAFRLVRRLRREDVAMYLRTRREQGFNAVALVAVGSDGDLSEGASDAYGHPAFAVVHGRPDPTRPIVTPGHDPAVEGAYDFWDHLDYCVDQSAAEGLYVLLLPTWGGWVVVGTALADSGRFCSLPVYCRSRIENADRAAGSRSTPATVYGRV